MGKTFPDSDFQGSVAHMQRMAQIVELMILAQAVFEQMNHKGFSSGYDRCFFHGP